MIRADSKPHVPTLILGIHPDKAEAMKVENRKQQIDKASPGHRTRAKINKIKGEGHSSDTCMYYIVYVLHTGRGINVFLEVLELKVHK